MNKEVLTTIGFFIAFIIFIMSSYGVGKAESDNDKPLKDFAAIALYTSIIGMIATWFIQHGLLTPSDSVLNKSTQNIYLFLMYLIPVTIGMGTVSASAYGLGKHEKYPESIEYKVSLVFFIIGLVVSVSSTSIWASGNFMAKRYELLHSSKDKLTSLGNTAVKELADCEQKIAKSKIDAMLSKISEESSPPV